MIEGQSTYFICITYPGYLNSGALLTNVCSSCSKNEFFLWKIYSQTAKNHVNKSDGETIHIFYLPMETEKQSTLMNEQYTEQLERTQILPVAKYTGWSKNCPNF